VEGQLTLVHGAAGTGKTILTAAWVTAGLAPGPVAWATLDRDVDAPGPFWSHVVHALSSCGVTLAEIGPPARAEEVDPAFLDRVAAVVSEQSGPVVLVLDEYDAVPGAAVDSDLERFLRSCGGNLRLVILSRRLPGLRLARYRAAGELTEIGPDDLAFTPDESADLFQVHGVEVPTSTAADLTERTGGWATGLRLSAMALARGTNADEVVHLVTAPHGDIAAFLLAEVVDAQPPAVRDLLLRTCLLESVSGELADAMTGRSDGQRVLTELARTGSFVRPVPGEPSWFTYHEVFGRALQGRLLSDHPGLVPRLRRRSSRWLADNGRLTDAVAQAVEAGDWQLAAVHVVDHLAVGHLLVGLETHRLGTMFARMPTDTAPNAHVWLVRAALAMARFDAAAAVHALAEADGLVEEVDAHRRPTLELGIATVRVIVSRLTTDLPTAERSGAVARRLMAQVPAERLAEHPELPALALSSLGTMQLWHGSLDAAEESLRAGLAAARGPSTEHARSNCLGQLAFLDYLKGHLREATDHAVQALLLIERSGLPPQSRVPVGHLAAAAVAWEWNDLVAARSHTRQAASATAARHDPSIAVMVVLLRARLHRAGDRVPEAIRVLRGAVETRDRLSDSSLLRPMLLLEEVVALLQGGETEEARMVVLTMSPGAERSLAVARLELSLGRPDAALKVLDDAGPNTEGSPLVQVPLALARADALLALSRRRDAISHLEGALRLARPPGIRRPFAEAAPWVRRWLDTEGPSDRYAWLAPDAGRGGAEGGATRAASDGEAPFLVSEPLTERELEVLRLVAEPMTSREVAEALHLSLHTVKTHVRSILRKLSASSRNEAVRRARSLELI
jgi:LuxR family maltose regulon positive regulatory protein